MNIQMDVFFNMLRPGLYGVVAASVVNFTASWAFIFIAMKYCRPRLIAYFESAGEPFSTARLPVIMLKDIGFNLARMVVLALFLSTWILVFAVFGWRMPQIGRLTGALIFFVLSWGPVIVKSILRG